MNDFLNEDCLFICPNSSEFWVTMCQEIKQALASISYFDTWDSEVVAECCRVSSVAEYPADTIILGPGTGTSHTVYFILEGVCKMVQNLQVQIKTNSRQKTLYKLHRPFDSKTSHSKSTSEEYSSTLFNQNLFHREIKKVKMSNNHEHEGNNQMGSLHSEIDIGEEPQNAESAKLVVLNPVVEGTGGKKSNSPRTGDSGLREENNSEADALTNVDVTESNPEKNGKDLPPGPEGPREQQESEEIKSFEESEPTATAFEPDHHLKVLEECRRRGQEVAGVCKKADLPERPKNVECFFVQTGLLNKGACFGLEKCQKENFIMSTVKVKCLKIPRRFLFKHNPCYTWNRIRLFHSLYLPKEKEILERLRIDRMWIQDRGKLSAEIVSWRSIPSYTLINEVPASVRLSEVLL